MTDIILSGLDREVEASARRPLGATLGNSKEANNFNWTPGSAAQNTYLRQANGAFIWANVLSHQRVNFPISYNFGFPGKSIGEIATLGLASILALNPRPSVVLLGCPTNNIVKSDGQETFDAIVNGVTIGGTVYPGVAATILALLGAGIKVIARPIDPRVDTVLTASQVGVILRYNRWLWQVSRNTYGVYVPDYTRDLLSVTSTLFAPLTGIMNVTDSLHENSLGAYYKGKGIATILNGLFPKIDVLAANAAVYSASAPYNNLVPNPQLTGTSGTLTNAAGTSPDSHTLSRLTAGDTLLTVTGSTVASVVEPQYNALQMNFAGTFTSAGPASATSVDVTHGGRLSVGIAQANLTVGDILEGYIGVEVDASTVGIANPSLVIRDGANTRYNHAMWPSNGGQSPAEAWSGVLYTGEFEVQDVSQQSFFQAFAYGRGDVAGSQTMTGNVRFRRPTLVKKLP